MPEGGDVTILTGGQNGGNGQNSAQVPSVRGQSESDARDTLRSAGFRRVSVTRATTNNQADDGKVIAQSPGSGSSASTDQPVQIVIGQFRSGGFLGN